MWYVSLTASPVAGTDDFLKFGGAHVNCWLSLPEREALKRAAQVVEMYGWRIDMVDDSYEAMLSDYPPDTPGFRYFEQAVTHGEIVVFHAWPKGAEAEDDRYENPVDGQTYLAPSHRYRPDNPRSKAGEKVYFDHVRLLSAEEAFEKHTSVEAMCTFARAAEAQAKKLLAKAAGPANVLAQFECTEKGHSVGINYHGPLRSEEIQGLHDALSSLAHLKMKVGTLKFQIQFNVSQ